MVTGFNAVSGAMQILETSDLGLLHLLSEARISVKQVHHGFVVVSDKSLPKSVFTWSFCPAQPSESTYQYLIWYTADNINPALP